MLRCGPRRGTGILLGVSIRVIAIRKRSHFVDMCQFCVVNILDVHIVVAVYIIVGGRLLPPRSSYLFWLLDWWF